MAISKLISAAAAVLLAIAVSGGALADAVKGKKVFAKCKACHEVATPNNKVGPSLKGVFGRKAGSIEGFAYSDAMKSSGITWGEDTLKPYLADPKAVVPGTKMSFVGLKKEEEVEDVIDYLEEATK